MTSRGEAEAEARLELEVAARRLGIEIPQDLMAGVLHGDRGLRELTALLRRAESEQQDRTGAVEGKDSRA
jgi:hypothetical protein